MILIRVVRIRVDKNRAWSAVDRQPRKERPSLVGGERVYFKHRCGVWPNRPIPELVDSKLGELPPDSFVQLPREDRL